MNLGFTVDVLEGDAITFACDVLMVKYTPHSGGLDKRVLADLKADQLTKNWPYKGLEPGQRLLTPAPSFYKSGQVLIVGTVEISMLNYAAIRVLAANMLKALFEFNSQAKHVCTTLHGVNTSMGNDEVEAFRSMLLGFADAYEAGQVPPNLERVTFIEREAYRVMLMEEALEKFIPASTAPPKGKAKADAQPERVIAGVDSFAAVYQKPTADENSPHIFVAMPFSDDYDDHYYLAIRPAITQNDLLCIRLDQEESLFTGDIMEQVKLRIRKAKLMVALLDGRNPNVYLEVGYAWGVGTPAVLILNEEEEPPFDVKGARLLTYKKIHRLKETLTTEIKSLLRL
jgi:hypothetical protein